MTLQKLAHFAFSMQNCIHYFTWTAGLLAATISVLTGTKIINDNFLLFLNFILIISLDWLDDLKKNEFLCRPPIRNSRVNQTMWLCCAFMFQFIMTFSLHCLSHSDVQRAANLPSMLRLQPGRNRGRKGPSSGRERDAYLVQNFYPYLVQTV